MCQAYHANSSPTYTIKYCNLLSIRTTNNYYICIHILIPIAWSIHALPRIQHKLQPPTPPTATRRNHRKMKPPPPPPQRDQVTTVAQRTKFKSPFRPHSINNRNSSHPHRHHRRSCVATRTSNRAPHCRCDVKLCRRCRDVASSSQRTSCDRCTGPTMRNACIGSSAMPSTVRCTAATRRKAPPPPPPLRTRRGWRFRIRRPVSVRAWHASCSV